MSYTHRATTRRPSRASARGQSVGQAVAADDDRTGGRGSAEDCGSAGTREISGGSAAQRRRQDAAGRARGGQTGQGEMGAGTGGLSYRYGVVPERQSYLIMPSPVVQVGPIPRDWWRCRARGALKVSKYYINKTVTTYSTGLSGREGKPLSLRREVVPRTHPRRGTK